MEEGMEEGAFAGSAFEPAGSEGGASGSMSKRRRFPAPVPVTLWKSDRTDGMSSHQRPSRSKAAP